MSSDGISSNGVGGIQNIESTEIHGQESHDDVDPFAFDKEDFIEGMAQLGMPADQAEFIWNQISDGAPSISQDNFHLTDLMSMDEASSKNQLLMHEFLKIMKTDDAQSFLRGF